MITLEQAIERAKKYTGIKCSVSGMIKNHTFKENNFEKNFSIARESFLSGDLEELADFFGIYR